MTEEVKKPNVFEEQLVLVKNKDGSVDLKLTKTEEIVKPKELKEPWRVGVTDKGENVFAPIAGPNAVNVLHLKRTVAICKACRCTVHKRDAVVDPEGNVYCKPHWPYGEFEDPRKVKDTLTQLTIPELEGHKDDK